MKSKLHLLSIVAIVFSAINESSEQQGRRAPSAIPSVQSAQHSGNRRASLPSTTSGPSKGQPVVDDDDEPLSDTDSGDKFECPKADGLFPDPNNCKKFFLCGSWHSWSQSCPPSLYFDGKLKFCTFKTAQLTCGAVDEETIRVEEAERNQDNLLPCDPTNCQLPNCYCSEDGTQIPGNFAVNQIPQMVLMSFSGAINELVYQQYRKILGYSSKFNAQQTRHNPNGCGIRATFFINHEYSNYAEILWLASRGHEIAMHSITHRLPEIWWTDKANYSDWAEEMIGMREILLANTGNSQSNSALTRESLVGMRAPYIKPGGDHMFEMAHDFGLLYDSSVVAPRGSPPYWPFTWDYRQPFDCANNNNKKSDQTKNADGDQILDTPIRQSRPRQKRDNMFDNKLAKKKAFLTEKKNQKNEQMYGKLNSKLRFRRNSPFLGRPLKCPTKAYPGLWEVPINPLFDEYNTCHHADQCVFPHSDESDTDQIFNFLKENFDRHYTTNRAPFQLNFHVTWFTQKGHTRALTKFVDYLLANHKDVWFVTFQDMISWIRDPLPLTQLDFKCTNSTLLACNRPHTCVLKHYLDKDNAAATEDNPSKSDTRYMQVCHPNVCPQQYQWFGNYAGKKHDFKSIMQLVDEAVGADTAKQ